MTYTTEERRIYDQQYGKKNPTKHIRLDEETQIALNGKTFNKRGKGSFTNFARKGLQLVDKVEFLMDFFVKTLTPDQIKKLTKDQKTQFKEIQEVFAKYE